MFWQFCLRFKLLPYILFFFILFSTVAYSQVQFYVSPAGDDSDGLSWATAFDTIQEAIDAAATGDVITIDDGTYSGTGNVNLEFWGKILTVQSRHGALHTIIDGGTSGRAGRLAYFPPGSNVDGMRFKGLTVLDGRAYDGIGGGGLSFVETVGTAYVEEMIFDGCATDKRGGGILAEASHVVVRRSIFRNNYSKKAAGGITHYGIGGGVEAEYCLFYDNQGKYGGAFAWYGSGVNVASNCTFVDNTATATPNSAAIWGGSGGTMTIINGVEKGNGSDPFTSSAGNVTVSYSLSPASLTDPTGNILADPLFADEANDDFTLSNSSQAINSGLVVAGVHDRPGISDLTGAPIDASPDRGAYENQ